MSWHGVFLKAPPALSAVLSCSVSQSYPTLWPHGLQHQASLSFTIPQSLRKLMSIESVMPSNQLILCRPLLLLHSIFPSTRKSYLTWTSINKYYLFDEDNKGLRQSDLVKVRLSGNVKEQGFKLSSVWFWFFLVLFPLYYRFPEFSTKITPEHRRTNRLLGDMLKTNVHREFPWGLLCYLKSGCTFFICCIPYYIPYILLIENCVHLLTTEWIVAEVCALLYCGFIFSVTHSHTLGQECVPSWRSLSLAPQCWPNIGPFSNVCWWMSWRALKVGLWEEKAL